MKKKFSKYIFLTLLILILVIALIGIGIWNKPHRNIKDAIAIEANAIALYQCLQNESAHTAYVNEIVAVTGKVKQVKENQQKQQVILLATDIDGGSVNCTMEQNIKNIKEGEAVHLKGICIGYSGEDGDLKMPGDVFLIRCYPF